MIFKPQRLGNTSLPEDELVKDKKGCRRFGPCGVGQKALYLNSFYIDRRYYVPLEAVTRVYKRVAMSKGGFTGKGIFASIPYLVVEYEGGKEKQCNFKYEDQVDQMVACIKERCPHIPVHSAQAGARLKEKERRLLEQRPKEISKKAQENVAVLEEAAAYLEKKPELYTELSAAAKKKRVFDKTNPAYKWVALFITLMGAASLAYGVFAVATHQGFAMYFLLFGLAVIFIFSSANVLPTAKNNKRAIEQRLAEAVEAMEGYVKNRKDFPVPGRYAHPQVLYRMREILLQGRTETLPEALGILKSDLKALNADVEVEQEEFDQIMAIKPIFLVMDYQ